MDNPNVASGSQPAFLDSISVQPIAVGSGIDMSQHKSAKVPYMASNSEAVTGTTYSFGLQSDVAGQASMVPQGSQPAFKKLQPESLSTNPGPMGTDYKP